MTPRTRPAAPRKPIDSPKNKEASIATVKGCESIITYKCSGSRFSLPTGVGGLEMCVCVDLN